ncbi:MAG: hypothetical protein [Betabaculovirus sp.]|nr:MAG: hypothetical protein [Betabaculovirus sp.]
MMHYLDIENIMWTSLANIKSIVEWDKQLHSPLFQKRNEAQLFIINIKCKNKLFKYTG